MKLRIVLFFLCVGFLSVSAQQRSGLDSALHRMSQQKDPQTALEMMNNIIKRYHLDKKKDAETFDVLYGTMAMSYATNRKYPQFERYIRLMNNKFNQTSFMNMAATKMLDDEQDVAYAYDIAKRTLKIYAGLKNDSTAKPKGFSSSDWKRFISFAQYPYYDTYAYSLFALKKYEEALKYQQMAFDAEPEQGLPKSVERFAELLERAGRIDDAKQLLIKRARLGKLSKQMTEQLQRIYVAEKGNDHALGKFLDSLQQNIQAILIQELKSKMLHETAPAFTLKDINGKQVSLSDFTGRTVVLDLWATWCMPCIASFPAMQVMVQQHPEVTFLFIAVEEQEKDRLQRVRSFIQKKQYPFTVLIDEPVEKDSDEYRVISAYKPMGIPAKYIIDKNGILRFKTTGFNTENELINELNAMITILNE